ncbi:MAG: DUF2892 domain-containing protein [Betaproteobacteria bacterium]
MFYVKNVPNWERILRLIAGVIALGFFVLNWGTSSMAVGVGVMGAVLAMTGLIGFCPMCAMVGRKLNRDT